MATRIRTIDKTFVVPTRNLLILPKGHDDARAYPLVVALHGMGQTAPEFAGRLDELTRLPAMIFVPEGCYPFEIRTGPQLRIGRAWYLYNGDDEAFVRSMDRSGRHLRALVARISGEHRVDPDHVYLLGHSQGGYFAGYEAVRHASRYRGVVVIGARVKTEVLGRQLRRPGRLEVLMLHGRKDRAVPYALAERCHDALREAGVSVRLKAYDSGHALSREQLADAKRWLGRRIRPGNPERPAVVPSA